LARGTTGLLGLRHGVDPVLHVAFLPAWVLGLSSRRMREQGA